MPYVPVLSAIDAPGPLSSSRLYHAARAVSGALGAAEVASSVFEHALNELGATSAGLWLVEEGAIQLVAGVGQPREVVATLTPIPLSSDLPAAESIRAGRVLVYGSQAERDRRWPELAFLQDGSEAVAVLPLVAAEQVLGCLHIGYPAPMRPDELDIPHLTELSELCAAALYRARLYDAERERQAFLLDAWSALADAGGYADTLRRLASLAVPRLADLCLIDVKDASQRVRRMAAVHADPAKAALTRDLVERYPPLAGGPHPASTAMTTGRSTWSPTMSDEFLRATTRDEHHYLLVKELGFSSYATVPLVAGGEILGAITLVSAGSGRVYRRSDLALAEELASRVASVVAAARRRDREHQLVHELQRLLLPEQLPRAPGLEIAVRYLTAAIEAEAGGDFYDVVNLPSGLLGLMVGDVEGHDTTAAATMGQLRSASRALAGQIREPGMLVDELRSSWELLGFGRTATAIFCTVDPASGDALVASAGHLPPVLIDSNGEANFLHVQPSPPLGLQAEHAEEQHFALRTGSTLLFFTDGLVEHRYSGLPDELERLRRLLEGSADMPLEELCDVVLEAHHAQSLRQDDVALLAVRRLDRN
ncbi:MAG TPA: SpoIIE family protein phosphatase [Acidimicrobiales bacterium]|nr:SpoIIE family protein phosphatase [Acidimicrobiales bacterium]